MDGTHIRGGVKAAVIKAFICLYCILLLWLSSTRGSSACLAPLDAPFARSVVDLEVCSDVLEGIPKVLSMLGVI